jgi:hypothetical protein
MAQRITMRPKPKALTDDMIRLIEQQAAGVELFTLPGEVVVELARKARQAMPLNSVAASTGAAEEVVAFLTPAQRAELWAALSAQRG